MFHIQKIKVNCYTHLSLDKEIIFKPGVNLIIGKNGSGKTSFLRMVDGIPRNANFGLDQESLGKFKENSELVKVICEDENSETTMATNVRAGNTGNWQSSHIFNQRIRFITSDRRINMASAASNPIPNISRDIAIPEPGTEIDISLEFTNAVLKDLFKLVEEFADTQNISEELLKTYQDGLIDFDKDIRIDLKRSSNPIYFTDYKGREIQINDLSSGEKEYLYFYAFLKRVDGDENKIILIDEPELHLHSSQLRKLCELIKKIGLKNQVIIATHSGELLQSFIDSNIVLVNRGEVTNISSSSDLGMALEYIGLPIDPSIFTAVWICAENDPNSPLKGENAPTTPTILEWIFDKDIKKRFWSFGGDWRKAEVITEGVQLVSSKPNPISLVVILDGDKKLADSTSLPPNETKDVTSKGVLYFDFWEIENLFFLPDLLNSVIPEKEGKSGVDQFWSVVESKKENLYSSALKTVLKNTLRKYSVDRTIKDKPADDLKTWQSEVAEFKFDEKDFKEKFEKVIKDKNWKWIPGKEAFGYLLELEPKFWEKVKEIQLKGEFKNLVSAEASIKSLISEVEKVSKQ